MYELLIPLIPAAVKVLIPFIAIGIVLLIWRQRCEKKEGIIASILQMIHDLIMDAEKTGEPGENKMEKVLAGIDRCVDARQKGWLARRYGSVRNAAEYVFNHVSQPIILEKGILEKLRRLSGLIKK